NTIDANFATVVKPGFTGSDPNLGIQASGYIFFPTTGTWNMQVGSDDGVSLFMGRENAQIAIFDGGRGYGVSSGNADIATVASYHSTILFKNPGGGGGLPFAASNASVQPTALLVGDPAGQLRVAEYLQGQQEPRFLLTARVDAGIAGDGVLD